MLLQGHKHRCGPRWQHRLRPYRGPRCYHWLLTSLPSSLQFCLSSLCPYPSVPFHFAIIYLILFVVPGVSEHLRSSPEWSQECYDLLLCPSLWCWAGTSQAWSITPGLQLVYNSRPAWQLTGDHLRLDPFLGPMVPVWRSSQACSLISLPS